MKLPKITFRGHGLIIQSKLPMDMSASEIWNNKYHSYVLQRHCVDKDSDRSIVSSRTYTTGAFMDTLGLIQYFEPPPIFKNHGFLLDDSIIKDPDEDDNLPNFQEYIIHGATFEFERDVFDNTDDYQKKVFLSDNCTSHINLPCNCENYSVFHKLKYYRMVNVCPVKFLERILEELKKNKHNNCVDGVSTDLVIDKSLTFEKFQQNGFCLKIEKLFDDPDFDIESIISSFIGFLKERQLSYMPPEFKASIAFCHLKCRDGILSPNVKTCPITIVKQTNCSLRQLLWYLVQILRRLNSMVLSFGTSTGHVTRFEKSYRILDTIFLFPEPASTRKENDIDPNGKPGGQTEREKPHQRLLNSDDVGHVPS